MSGYEISMALIRSQAGLEMLIQQYGGLIEVVLDPSSGRISLVPGQRPALLFDYQDFHDGGCYCAAWPDTFRKLSGIVWVGVMFINQVQASHRYSLAIAVHVMQLASTIDRGRQVL